ncbi:hypothetical protein DNTS_028573, partial [Danionella cerebrum]
MTKEDDMKEVELNEMDLEKQPMTGDTPTGTEKNGCVKVKVPEETEVKFTGLSKEELLKVAGTAGWVRTRWVLLVLFWLGWVGMLAGAIVIIVQAPRCKPIPEMHWWNEGPLYQIPNLNAFSANGLKGVEEKLDYLNQMKVKGLVLGPIHTVQADQSHTLELTTVNPLFGTETDLTSLLERAHRKGISIVLDLTPNYEGASVWFNSAASVAEKIKNACMHWLGKGVDGIFFSNVDDIASTDAWPSIQGLFNKTEETTKRALMGTVSRLSSENFNLLLNHSGVDLLMTGIPDPAGHSGKQVFWLQRLCTSHEALSLGWGLGRALSTQSSKSQAYPVRLYQTLLFTLPGTPVFSAGDEVGLKSEDERTAVRDFFKALSDIRGKERSLLHGEYINLYNSPTSLAFVRVWDQSERFLVALNWGNDTVTMKLSDNDLPADARVRAATDTEKLAVDSKVPTEKLELGAKQAVMYFIAGVHLWKERREMKDTELKEADQAKQLMTRETGRNGCVKVNVPESSREQYTGLSKEQLIRVAGTPGWVRTRWVLLVLFCLGWVGMLAGAIVIIVQAPRCKPIPEMHWWNEGLEEKLDYLSMLKVKALVLSGIHTVEADRLDSLNLSSLNPEAGSEKDLDSLLKLSQKKGISMVMNLTPNYQSTSMWFENPSGVAEKIQQACSYWLKKGFDGIFLSDVGDIAKTSLWSSIKDIFNRTDEPEKVALMGSVSSLSVDDISLVLNNSGVDLLLTRLPDPAESGQKQSQAILKLHSNHRQTSLAWGAGHPMATRAQAYPIRLYQTLLFTLPGTPVFTAGDEVGLKAEEQLETLWDLETPVEEKNAKAKLRGKERSLLHGEYIVLGVTESTLVFLRRWDQSERFLSVLNWGDQSVTMNIRGKDEKLPDQALVRVSTDPAGPAVDSLMSLQKVQLGSKQALLLSFPYT